MRLADVVVILMINKNEKVSKIMLMLMFLQVQIDMSTAGPVNSWSACVAGHDVMDT